MSLTSELKHDIQVAYSTWLAKREFKPRRGQREMIACVAKTVSQSESRIAIIEAGTGTGKTASYCLASIPIALSQGKRLIISTATVALQEQILFQDLPDIKQNAGLNFSFSIVKGRARYLCPKRLDDQLKYRSAELPSFEMERDQNNSALYQSMLDSFARGEWNGELDDWDDDLDVEAWTPLTMDHRGCLNKRCSFISQCPFFISRTRLDTVEVLVINHDLLLADLSLGGGAVLPNLSESILIVDEAHHLPAKTRNHFSAGCRLRSTSVWLQEINQLLSNCLTQLDQSKDLFNEQLGIDSGVKSLVPKLEKISALVGDLEFKPQGDGDSQLHRFVEGLVPTDIGLLMRSALTDFALIQSNLGLIYERIDEIAQGRASCPKRYDAEDWLLPIGQLERRLQATEQLFHDFAIADTADLKSARWLKKNDFDVEFATAPLQTGMILEKLLWDKTFSAICTSATLTFNKEFKRFQESVGLPFSSSAQSIPSPFDYFNNAVLNIPAMKSEPSDVDAHTEEIIRLLPKILKAERSALVLFTSWKQLNSVLKNLPVDLEETLLVQGKRSKRALMEQHKKKIDRGEASYLIGVASFSEGIDLPGAYCDHVVIAKLPFSVPDDPVAQSEAEWFQSTGRNPFSELSVPEATQGLVQACGRLLRNESDTGQITILDRRLVSRSYGRYMLASLPPFKISVETYPD